LRELLREKAYAERGDGEGEGCLRERGGGPQGGVAEAQDGGGVDGGEEERGGGRGSAEVRVD
jgi:hypothetical protein